MCTGDLWAISTAESRRSVRFGSDSTPDAGDGTASRMRYRVEQVLAAQTYALRQTVLRPHQAVADQALPDDDDALTGSFAAIDDQGEIIGTARVAPGTVPEILSSRSSPDLPEWQIQGVTVREDLRNAGIGSEVLRRVIHHVAERGGGLVWCNARIGARGLYRRADLVEAGGVWEIPSTGPHVVMWRVVNDADGQDAGS
jgi:ribosomal protein S18 acetylase RimI-like enzyme